jgi:hypothetical protein
MSQSDNQATPETWVCARCDGAALEPGKVNVGYMGGMYSLELFRCPRCGLVLIPEYLATGQMKEAEELLENK